MSEVRNVREGSVTDVAARLAARWAENTAGDAEVTEATAEPAETAPEAPQAATEEAAAPEVEAHGSDEEGTDSEVEQVDHPTRLDVDAMANDYGMDKNEFMQTVRQVVRVGDEETEVGLHELVTGYQRGREHQAQMDALERRQKAWEAEQSQKREALEHAGRSVAAVMDVVNNSFTAEEQSIHDRYGHTDWSRLRGENPGEYSARWTEYQTALAGVGQRRQAAEHQIAQGMQAMQAEQQKQYQERLERSRKELPRYIPAWSDAGVAQREAQELASYAKDVLGASDADIASIVDARALKLLHDSWTLHKLRAAGEEVKAAPAKVAPAPPGRTVSPGFARRRTVRKQVESAEGKLRESGKLDDAASALSARWEARSTQRRNRQR